MPAASVLVTENDGVVEITLARPELLNRVDDTLRADLIAALAEAGGKLSTRVIILAAQGKVFSAGGDFAMMKQRHGDRAATERGTRESRRLVDTLLDVPAPVIAAVHG